MEFKLSTESALKIKADILVLGIYKGQKYSGVIKSLNDILKGALKNLSEEEGFDGDLGKSLMLSSTFGKIASKRVLLVGLGEKDKFTHNTIRKAGILVIKKIKDISTSAVFGSEFSNSTGDISSISEGLLLGSYEFSKYKSDHSDKSKIEKN